MLKVKTYIRWVSKFVGHDIWHFNLDDFSVDYAIDHDFEKVYHLTKDSF